MPKNTKVEKVYTALKEERGMPKGKAARIAQSKTGLALSTGKPPKAKKKRKPMPMPLRAGLRGTY